MCLYLVHDFSRIRCDKFRKTFLCYLKRTVIKNDKTIRLSCYFISEITQHISTKFSINIYIKMFRILLNCGLYWSNANLREINLKVCFTDCLKTANFSLFKSSKSVPKDMYFVLAMFIVIHHLEYSSWSFRHIYSKSSLLWANTTWSSANFNVCINVLSTLYSIPEHFHFQIFNTAMSERDIRMGEWNNRRQWNMEVRRCCQTF